MFQPGDERIFSLNQCKGNYPRLSPSSGLTIAIVPIIVVYTKVDLVLPRGRQVSAESYFKERCGQSFETSTRNIEGQIPYTAVASTSCSEVSWSTLTSPSSLATCNFDSAGRYDAPSFTC